MRKILKYKKFVAAFLLVIMASELIVPASAFALTSGPTQPEAQKFEQASTTNMVDLFSGDMQYNIPLMDVGGYPINIAYQSGAGVDDEASWVGAGWTLNPGAVNRQVRGVPDDFNGDKITKEFNKKPFIRIGADLKFKPTIFGFTRNKEVGLKVGVFKDNYYGVGALVGVNAGINLTRSIAGPLSGGLGLGADLTTSSRDGVTVSPNLNLSVTSTIDGINDLTLGGSIKPQYNSREGLKTIELGSSFGFSALKGTEFGQTLDASSSNIYTIGATHSPHIEMPTKTTGFTFDFDAGTIAFGPYLGFGGSGFYSKNELEQPSVQKPAYGYLHSEKGKNDLDAVMDFNREKDIPYFKGVPAIAIPVITNDNFIVSSHEGAMQFRPFRSGTGIVFDAQAENKTANNTVGVTLGAGAMIQGGGSFYRMDAKTRTEKWTAGNNFKSNGDFQEYSSSNPLGEPAYFKRVGEKLKADELYASVVDDKARAVSVSFPGRPVASNVLLDKNRSPQPISSPINRTVRDRRGYSFSYMTAWEASRLGLDKYIRSYTGIGGLCATSTFSRHPRISIYRRPHHISEVTVTNPTGQRYVYGVPVYNVYQQETTFNVKDKKKELSANLYKTLRDEGETTIETGDNSPGNQKGRDHYFSKETTPPYATSFLLSGILSPDYIDRTGDGITDDDLGTAVKFNYTKQKHLYQWRAPFGQNKYNYNEGFLTDGKDDKANYVYGQREVWYLHSIESKTMVAIFELLPRLDGWGVEGMNGGINTSPDHGLKRLHKIKLYSKAEIQKAGGTTNATPIKVVNFEYEYTAWPNVDNNPNPGQGKLTLKKIWFTFGKNSRGESHPYVFSYQGGSASYDKRAVDRWGMYKPRSQNPAYTDPALSGTPTLNNSEWPYAVQDQTMANTNAGAWQLNEVELPSGGKIKITYESDDYAFVQNRPAMQMFTLNGLGTTGNNTNLISEDEILVNLPEGATSTSEFKEKYLRGMKYLYYKFHVQLTNDPKLFEYVPGYAEIDVDACERVSQNVGRIKLKMIGGKNPMSKNTWQFLRLSLPQIAYPGYDNSELTGSDFRKLIKSLKDAIQNLGELTTPFDERAEDNDFANTVKLDRSWVRLYTPDGYKLGGGSRVQKIEISDEWQTMSDQATAPAGIYGQKFEYKIASQGETGQQLEISSGVASYEPLLGGDENPFRQPITYRESVKMGLDNYYYMEEPLCESYYPAPSVGYSRVKVTSFGKETPTGAASENIGYTISEFFTAREFPTIVEQVPNDPKFVKPKFVLKILGADVTDRVVISQGYKVELNDMHGKPKKEQTFNKSGSLVSMMEYFFKTENPDAEFKHLSSTVSTVNYKGEVDHDAVLGMDIEMYTDMRQQYTKNEGRYIGAYGGAVPGGIIPLPFAKVSLAINKQVTSYNSASSIKVVQQYGILQSMRKTENGSTLTTENVLWDEETGEVLLTKTQNEYDDPIYNFTYPAHWAYSGMGPAYKNIGLVILDFSTHSTNTGMINQHASLLHAGDEVSTPLGLRRFWVTEEANGNKYLIDAAGNLATVSHQSIQVHRPGRRNMPSAAMGTVVMLQNPVEGNQLVINQGKHILDVANTIFKDEWAVPVNQRIGMEPKPSECPNLDFMEYFVKASMAYRYSFGRRAIFSMERDGQTVGDLVSAIYPELVDFDAQSPSLVTSNLIDFLYDEPASAYGFFLNPLHRSFSAAGLRFKYSLQNNDQGRFGDGTITINCVDPSFNDLVNSNLTTAQMKAYVDTAFCLRGTCPENTDTYVYELVQKNLPDNGPCGNQGGGGTSISLPEPGINGPEFCSGKVVLRFTIVVPRPMVEVCQEPVNQQINPYFMGIKGNWRPHQQYAYLVDRSSLASTTIPGSTDIRRSGYFNQFTNFWQYNPAPIDVFTPNTTDDKWVKTMESTGFNRKSEEIENKNALNLFNTAYFGFIETLPTAVGANMRYRDIAYDGFEDYGFKSSCADPRCPPISHFDFRQQILSGTVYCNTVGCVTTAKSHSGKYSLEIKNALTMTRAVTSQGAADGIEQEIVNRHADGRYILIGNELAKGFAPTPGQRYIMSFWVHEGANPPDASVSMGLQINGGGNILNGLKCPVVEDWKRVWVDFTLPANSTSFSLTMTPGAATTYVDDIRIFPYNGQVKSYAYDERSLRLMAEMDENNFATFYEYDDEGMLIRVKKETERGIMTLKEGRTSLRKKPQ
jgi:hypothetical protein